MKTSSDVFGELLTRIIRDGSIAYYDDIVSGKSKALWHKNIHRELSKFDEKTKEIFRTVLSMVLDDTGFEFLREICSPEDDETKIELKINDTNILQNPGELQEKTEEWFEKYSTYPATIELLKRYGTEGWPRILLK